MGVKTLYEYFYKLAYGDKGADKATLVNDCLDVADAEIKANKDAKHTQGTDQGLDAGGANAVIVADVKDAVTKKHTQGTDYSNIVICANYDHPDDAITAIGASNKTLLVTEAETCDTNFTVPANVSVKFERGGKWTINTGITVTINGQIDAGLFEIFTYVGTGTLAGMTTIDKVYPQWWGALGDGSNDDTTAIQSAINMGGLISFPKGIYIISSTLTIAYNNTSVVLQGVGFTKTKIQWAGAAGGTMITLGDSGHTTESNYVEIRNLFISGNYSASRLIDSYTRLLYINRVRLGGVNAGVALELRANSYYVSLDKVEFRNDGAHTSSAIETNTNANAFDFKDVKITNFANYGLLVSGVFNKVSFNGGTIEGCGSSAIYINAAGTLLSVTDMYIENNAGAGEGMIETTAAVTVLALKNLYMNPDAATEYAIKVVGTYVEAEGIQAVTGFGTSVFNIDVNSRLYCKSQINSSGNTMYSGAGIYYMERISEYEWEVCQSPASTVAKNSGTWYVDLDLAYAQCNIELTVLGRYESASYGISKKWAVFCYPQSDGSVIDIDSVELYSLGDATKTELTMAVSAVGTAYKVRFTFTNAGTVRDFNMSKIFWNIKWSSNNVMKAPIPQ